MNEDKENSVIGFPSSHRAFSESDEDVGAGAEKIKGGGGGPVDPSNYVTKEHLALTMDAVRSQIDAKFAEVIGKMSTRNDIIVAGISMAALILAMFAFGGDRFDGGVQVSSAVSQIAAQNEIITSKNAEAIAALSEQVKAKDAQIDALITAMEMQANRNAKDTETSP